MLVSYQRNTNFRARRSTDSFFFAWQAQHFVHFGIFSSYVAHVTFFEHYGTIRSFFLFFLENQILLRLRFIVFCNTKSTISFFAKILSFRFFRPLSYENATFGHSYENLIFAFFDPYGTKSSLLFWTNTTVRNRYFFHFLHDYGTKSILFFVLIM